MKTFFYSLLLSLIVLQCKQDKPPEYTWKTLDVTATAYNSLTNQTSSDPHITAFGDSLVPGNKYIAVSRDLLAMGLKHNTPVKIEGREGLYLVKDKMNRRWKKKIDIYMGLNVEAALEWGKKKVTISYGIKNKQPDTSKE